MKNAFIIFELLAGIFGSPAIWAQVFVVPGNDTVTADKIADGAVDTAALANGAVSSGKISANAITAGKIADATITGADFEDGTITGTKLSLTGAITPETTRTVNLNNGQTPTQLQNAIDAVGKYVPYGVTITFQFADGTYSLGGSTLWFAGFFGGGTVDIQGDTADYSTNGTPPSHSVIFSCTSSCIYLANNQGVTMRARNFKLNIGNNNSALLSWRNSKVEIMYINSVATGKSGAMHFNLADSFVYAKNSHFSEGSYGFYHYYGGLTAAEDVYNYNDGSGGWQNSTPQGSNCSTTFMVGNQLAGTVTSGCKRIY